MKTKLFIPILLMSSLALFYCSNAVTGPSTTKSPSHNIDPSIQKSASVEFESEGVTLSGTLWLPEGQGPWPGMIIVHGSGRSTKSSYSTARTMFLQNNIAVLTYDKRGVGDSGGVYVENGNGSEQNLTLLARDANKALDQLKSYDFIENDKIGIWGNSQAGWIVPVTVTLRNDIKFSILYSGPTVTVGEENYYSELTGDNSSTRNDLSQEEISQKLKERGPSGFDPAPFIAKMNNPGLWLFGSADESIPVPESVAILNEFIENYGKDFTIKIFEGANHGLAVNGVTSPELWTSQFDFLRKHNIIK